MDLASRDSYMQKLASKVISQRDSEPKKRQFVPFKAKNDTGPAKKKKKVKTKNSKDDTADVKISKQKPSQKPPAAQKKPNAAKTVPPNAGSVNGTEKPQGGPASSFSTVDQLRKRLHEKIEASRGQGAPKDALSEAVQAKRAKRKLERERKKRKRKEFLMKKLAEQGGAEIKTEEEEPKAAEEQAPPTNRRDEAAVLFNKVEVVEDRYMDKSLKAQKKKQRVKGQIAPLTGKNYRQLLERVEARKAKLEELKETDEAKAEELQKKIQWTNMLYRAEGLKIKDDEELLRASLRRKEKNRAQRKKKWDRRSENTVEKMQQQQDKRRRNIQKQKRVKSDKKKDRARRKGRVLPEDLKKVVL